MSTSPSMPRMSGSATKDKLEKLTASGVRDPGANMVPGLTDDVHPAFVASGNDEDSLQTPLADHTRGATMTGPCGRVVPNATNKGKCKIEERTVEPDCESDESEPEGNQEADKIITADDRHRVKARLEDTDRDDHIVRVKILVEGFEEFRKKYVKAGRLRPDFDARRDLQEFRHLVNGKEAISGHLKRIRGGIDFIREGKSSIKDSTGTRCSVAVSVVISPTWKYNNEYSDNRNTPVNYDTIWYSGHGEEGKDQKFVRGNKALMNCHDLKYSYELPVRVLQGVTDASSPSHTIYEYLGLYNVVNKKLDKKK
ncbi:unnamed protein product [Calypogeia fissa]